MGRKVTHKTSILGWWWNFSEFSTDRAPGHPPVPVKSQYVGVHQGQSTLKTEKGQRVLKSQDQAKKMEAQDLPPSTMLVTLACHSRHIVRTLEVLPLYSPWTSGKQIWSRISLSPCTSFLLFSFGPLSSLGIPPGPCIASAPLLCQTAWKTYSLALM